MREAFFMEENTVKVGSGPIDLDAGANTGARVDMALFDRVAFLVILAAGTTPSAHLHTLRQHDAASAGNSKDLSVMNPYYYKLNASTSYTKVEPTVAAAAYDLDTLVGDNKYVVVFEVLAEQLDLANSYRWVSLDTTDVGGAQLGTVVAIPRNAKEKPAYEKVV